jgi:predicted nucleic acid-binding protein
MPVERVLIDTSAWVEALRLGGDTTTRAAVTEATVDGRAAICEPVLLELWNGAGSARDRDLLRGLERDLTALATTQEVWALARGLASRCRAAGVTVPAIDLLIAAHARHHGADLLHRDRHFDQIARAVDESGV